MCCDDVFDLANAANHIAALRFRVAAAIPGRRFERRTARAARSFT